MIQITNLDRYNFYSNYNSDVHDYCPIVHPDRTRFSNICQQLQCLGEAEDFLAVLQQSEPIVEYCKLIDLIGQMLGVGLIEPLIANGLSKSAEEVRNYIYVKNLTDPVLCDVASLIPKVTQSIESLTSEIESELGLPIAAIDLIISSLAK